MTDGVKAVTTNGVGAVATSVPMSVAVPVRSAPRAVGQFQTHYPPRSIFADAADNVVHLRRADLLFSLRAHDKFR